MRKRWFFGLGIVILLVTACQPATTPSSPPQSAYSDLIVSDATAPTPTSNAPMDIPTSLPDPIVGQATVAPPPTPPEPIRPRPEDAMMQRDNVYIEKVDLLTLESYPLQFNLVIVGNLPTPCHELRVKIDPPDAQNRIMVGVYSVVSPEKICIQVLSPFSQTIPLGSFAPGHYTVWVNGKKVAEFDA